MLFLQEELEDTKRKTKHRQLKKIRQYNGQKKKRKRTSSDLQKHYIES